MPVYEYLCEKCNHEFEREQRISDDPIKTCPKCRSRKVKRLISRTSFVLKGGGWYSDLYSSAGSKGEAASGADASESASKKDETKKDSSKSKKDSAPSKDKKKSKSAA